MTFASKFRASASIVAVVALMSGVLPIAAFAQLGGPPHAPYLTRAVPHKAQAPRPANGSVAADRPAAGTRPDVATEPFPVVTSGRAPSRAPVIVGRHHGGPPRSATD